MNTNRVIATATLCILLNCSAGAQAMNEKERLASLVRMIRTEKAKMYESEGIRAQGTRVVSQVTTYDAEGRKTEQLNYTDEGLPVFRNAFAYDNSGELIEKSEYRADGSLVRRYVYTRDKTKRKVEQLVYNADGVLSAKSIDLFDEKGRVTESLDYEADGSLQLKDIFFYDGKDRVNEVISCAYKPDASIVSAIKNDHGEITTIDRGKIAMKDTICGEGFLISRDVYAYNNQGNSVERLSYTGDRSLISREVIVDDAHERTIEVLIYNPHGALRSRIIYVREYDMRGNWIKEIKSKWNFKVSKFEPEEITYRTITYY